MTGFLGNPPNAGVAMRTSLEKKYGSVHSGALGPSVLTASGARAKDECNAAQGGKDSKRFSARRENLVLQNASLSPQDYGSPGNFRTNRDDGSISERLPESLATRLRSGEFGCSQPFDLLAIAVSCSSHAPAGSRKRVAGEHAE